MFIEELFNSEAIGFDLDLQGLEYFYGGNCQPALGSHDRFGDEKLTCFAETLQAFLDGVRMPKFMRVEEFLPFAFPRLFEKTGCRKLLNESPSPRFSPIIKGFKCSWIILIERLLKAIYACSALLDEIDFIAAEQSQFMNERIERGERFPAMPVGSKRIGHAPSIEMIGFASAWDFPFAIALSAFRINWIDGTDAFEELLNGSALISFDANSKLWELSYFLAKRLPSGSRMGELEIGNNRATLIDDDNRIVILCPIEAGEMGEFLPGFHIPIWV